jgi:hypothetical protein
MTLWAAPFLTSSLCKNLTFKASCFSEMFQPADLGPMEIHSILNVKGSGRTPIVGSTQPTISDGRNGRTSILLPLTTPDVPNGPMHDGHHNQAPLTSLDNSGSQVTQPDPQALGPGQPGLPPLGNDLMAQLFISKPSSSQRNNLPELQPSADPQQGLSQPSKPDGDQRRKSGVSSDESDSATTLPIDMRALQREDKNLRRLYQWVKTEKAPKMNELFDPELKSYVHCFKRFLFNRRSYTPPLQG